MSAFDIIRTSPKRLVSLTTPAVAALRGIAFQDSGGATVGTAELADGLKPLAGFLTREVKVGGPTLNDVVFEDYLQPFTAGEEASFEKADAFEAEGDNYIDNAGGDLINAATPLESELSFSAGKLCLRQAGQFAFYRLKAFLAVEDAANTIRIRVEEITTENP
jgi:hypothetical protein